MRLKMTFPEGLLPSWRGACLARLNYQQDFLGLAEFAYVLGVTKQRFSNRRTRHPLLYPEPTQQLAMGPIWAKDVIKSWLDEVEAQDADQKAH